MIYVVEQFENYKYKVNVVLKRLKMTILMIIAEIYSYMVYNGLVIISFNSYYTKGSEIIGLSLKYNTYSVRWY